MNIAQNQSQVFSHLWEINQKATSELMNLSGEEFSRWMSLNQEYVEHLAQPDPARALMAPSQYWGSIFTTAWETAGRRVEIITKAMGDASTVMSHGLADGMQAASKAAAETADVVGDAATHARRSVQQVAAVVEDAMDDDLQQIDGIGDVMAATLRKAGIPNLGALAMLDVSLLEDERHPLHPIAGRIVADQWVEQARALVSPEAS